MSEIKPWKEHIEKHDAYIIMCNVLDNLCEKEAIKKEVFERLRQAPSTDRKGHWREITAEEDEEMAFLGLVECTNCGLKGAFNCNYCPNCGVYMKGE